MKLLSILTLLFLYSASISAQLDSLPLLFETNFQKDISLNDFECTDSTAWRITKGTLELFGASEYSPRVRSPYNIAILKDYKVGSFVLEMKLKQTGKEYGHRDMCIFFGMKDPSNFYYVHLASKADPHAHSIFLVNDEPRVSIASQRTDGIFWGEEWHTIKIVRNVESGLIQVYFDDMKKPIMEATDQHFDAGYIGFGSFDDTGMIDEVKIWGNQTNWEEGFFSKGR